MMVPELAAPSPAERFKAAEKNDECEAQDLCAGVAPGDSDCVKGSEWAKAS